MGGRRRVAALSDRSLIPRASREVSGAPIFVSVIGSPRRARRRRGARAERRARRGQRVQIKQTPQQSERPRFPGPEVCPPDRFVTAPSSRESHEPFLEIGIQPPRFPVRRFQPREPTEQNEERGRARQPRRRGTESLDRAASIPELRRPYLDLGLEIPAAAPEPPELLFPVGGLGPSRDRPRRRPFAQRRRQRIDVPPMRSRPLGVLRSRRRPAPHRVGQRRPRFHFACRVFRPSSHVRVAGRSRRPAPRQV